MPDMFTRLMLSLVATGIAPGSFYELDVDGNRATSCSACAAGYAELTFGDRARQSEVEVLDPTAGVDDPL